tara:strand:- start:2562 stop:2906 length:345 start_codon:yes stop_codon:yes gene_type:complete
MSNYYPQTWYERETILTIASVIVYCKNVGTVDQRIAYQYAYLKERYGDNPLAENVPEYFKRMYNTAQGNDALDLDVWASNAMLYVGANPKSLKQELRKVSHKATKKLRKFIKTQ